MNPLKLNNEPLGPRSAMLQIYQRHHFIWDGPKGDKPGATTEDARKILIQAIEKYFEYPEFKFIPLRGYYIPTWWPY